MATAKDCHALISYYEKKYKVKYRTAAVVNRNTAKWGFDSILKGISPQETMNLIDYWFDIDTPTRHRLDWFFYNYDKLIESKAAQGEDGVLRQHLRSETEDRVKRWRERRDRGSAGSK